jgi:hypothetical protein
MRAGRTTGVGETPQVVPILVYLFLGVTLRGSLEVRRAPGRCPRPHRAVRRSLEPGTGRWWLVLVVRAAVAVRQSFQGVGLLGREAERASEIQGLLVAGKCLVRFRGRQVQRAEAVAGFGLTEPAAEATVEVKGSFQVLDRRRSSAARSRESSGRRPRPAGRRGHGTGPDRFPGPELRPSNR